MYYAERMTNLSLQKYYFTKHAWNSLSHFTTLFKILIITLFAFLCDLSQYISFHKHIFIHKTLFLPVLIFMSHEIKYILTFKIHTDSHTKK